ncbi:MAG: hypothetical protein E7086_05640 [Bacteroidales bacterium]|nr:hypothetical protein [Bacteroidales bacterium]
MKNEIDNKVLEENNISAKKKTSVAPIAILVCAALVLAGGLCIDNDSDAKMPVLLVAFVTAVFGVAKMFNQPTALVYEPHNEILNEEELFFDIKEKNNVIELLRNGEFTRLRSQAKDSSNHPLKVELYATQSGSIAIYRVYHFVPYTFEPLTGYEVCKR